MTKFTLKLIAFKVRKDWKNNDKKRDKGKEIPQSIQIFDNISYGKYGKYNKLAIYNKKENLNKKMPCIVVFHGGGFFYGTKDVYKFYSADLALRDFIILTFNYRLAPSHQYPSQLEDINQVMKWLCQNAENYNIDLDNLFFAGDSAGGSLVYTYTTMLSNPEFARKFDFDLTSQIKPKAIAINCGFCDFYLPDPDSPENLMLTGYLGKNGKEKYKDQLQVQNYVTKDFPPVYVTSASHDFVLYQFQPLVEVFTSRGVKIISKIYGNKDDESAIHVFNIDSSLPLAKECNDDECNFFKSFISYK